MKNLTNHTSSLILCLFEVVVGILLLIDPIGFTSAIIKAFGVVLAVTGVISLIKYFRADAQTAAVGQLLTRGLVALMAGIFCILKTGWFLATFPLLTILYGVVILIVGLVKLQWTIDVARLKIGSCLLPALSALLSLACAVVILLRPIESTVLIWRFTAIGLIVQAVLDVVVMWTIGKYMRDLES